jgi:hypothetical protein
VEVVVAGLSPACGASTISAGLARALVVPDRPVCLISFDPGASCAEDAGGSVARRVVPAVLEDPDEAAAYAATAVRLAGHEPGAVTPSLVWDVGARQVARGSVALGGAEVVVALAAGSGEPALAGLVRDVLADRHGSVLLACNRAVDEGPWARWADLCLPEARLGAARIARGRAAGGALGTALGRLAGMVESRALDPGGSPVPAAGGPASHPGSGA